MGLSMPRLLCRRRGLYQASIHSKIAEASSARVVQRRVSCSSRRRANAPPVHLEDGPESAIGADHTWGRVANYAGPGLEELSQCRLDREVQGLNNFRVLVQARLDLDVPVAPEVVVDPRGLGISQWSSLHGRSSSRVPSGMVRTAGPLIDHSQAEHCVDIVRQAVAGHRPARSHSPSYPGRVDRTHLRRIVRRREHALNGAAACRLELPEPIGASRQKARLSPSRRRRACRASLSAAGCESFRGRQKGNESPPRVIDSPPCRVLVHKRRAIER